MATKPRLSLAETCYELALCGHDLAVIARKQHILPSDSPLILDMYRAARELDAVATRGFEPDMWAPLKDVIDLSQKIVDVKMAQDRRVLRGQSAKRRVER